MLRTFSFLPDIELLTFLFFFFFLVVLHFTLYFVLFFSFTADVPARRKYSIHFTGQYSRESAQTRRNGPEAALLVDNICWSFFVFFPSFLCGQLSSVALSRLAPRVLGLFPKVSSFLRRCTFPSFSLLSGSFKSRVARNHRASRERQTVKFRSSLGASC